jgi:hypothetical protein
MALVLSCLLATLAVVHLIWAYRLSRRVLGSDLFDRKQQRIQLAMVWLLPLLGCALVSAVIGQDRLAGAKPEAHLELPGEQDLLEHADYASHSLSSNSFEADHDE